MHYAGSRILYLLYIWNCREAITIINWSEYWRLTKIDLMLNFDIMQV